MSPKESLLSIEDMHFSYPSQKEAVLEQVNVSLSTGEFLGVVGPNGGGKSTLLRLILGLLNPSQGKISIHGKSPRKNQRVFGYVSQNPRVSKDFPITAREVVLMGLLEAPRLWGGWSQQEIQRADKALDIVGMVDKAQSSVSELSGGQLQRVFLARALVDNPEILILDEPTSQIDPRGEQNILEWLRSLPEQRTIIFVTHDVAFVSKHIDRVWCVNKKVHSHLTRELKGDWISELYGESMAAVDHSHSHGGEE